VDPHHFDEDLDSTYHPEAVLDADPYSDLLFDADPDPTFHPDADPVPGPCFNIGSNPWNSAHIPYILA
jgi:hypothetical protein